MGPLKDSFLTTVWTHLQGQPESRTSLTALSASGSTDVRNAWNNLLEQGGVEGADQGMQAVLMSRPDVFAFSSNEGGEQVVGIAEGVRALNPADGMPAPPVSSSAEPAVEAPPIMVPPPPADSGGNGETGMDISGLGLAMPPDPKAPRLDKGKGKGKEVGKSRHGAPYIWNSGYKDLVWTPEMQQKKESDKSKESEMAWALYKAIEHHAGMSVSLSQLGSDFKVAELKKDPHFRHWRLLDILKAYADVFEITPDPNVAGGIRVKLQPGGQAALPDAEEKLAQEITEETVFLPERIENPKTQVEKVQALRIELILALKRRGGKVAIQDLGQETRLQEKKKLLFQELGQETRLQEKKKLLHQGKKLADWVKIFTKNFELKHDVVGLVVELLSVDVSDISMIERALNIRRREEPEPRSRASDEKNSSTGDRGDKGSDKGDRGGGGNSSKSSRGSDNRGGGSGAGGGARDRDRDRGRDRNSSRSSRDSGSRYNPYPPVSSYGAPPSGYGMPPAMGYGMPPAMGYGAYPAQYPPAPGYGTSQPSHYPPPAAGAPPGGAPPAGYPGYPPQTAAPPTSGYPPPAGYGQPPSGYPPQQPAASAYPPQSSGYPPQPAGYPPQSASYPPTSGYPPQQTAQSGYPAQQAAPASVPPQSAPPASYGAPPASAGAYGAAPAGYGAPPSGYGAPPSGYGAAPSAYGAPPAQPGAHPSGYPPAASAYPAPGAYPPPAGYAPGPPGY